MITKQKGCYDIYGIEAKKWKYVSSVIDSVCEKYNYNFIRTPIFEASDLFHRGIGETSDIVSKETYDFKDRGDRNITLRPEGTAGVVRCYIENKMYGDAVKPFKAYYNGTMYRYERPGSGRDRELTQFGMELIGSDDSTSDAEIISMAVNIFKTLGLNGVKVKLNSLGDIESRKEYREVLINYFKPYLNSLCDDCKTRFENNPLRILDCKVDNNLEIMKNAPKMIDYLNESSKKRFLEVQKYLDIIGIDYEIDPTIVRGLDYYSHTVFEIEADIPEFGSANTLGGGGRYDGLIETLGGPSTPSIGFACGFGRLMMALDKLDIILPINNSLDAFIMYVSDTEKECAISILNNLRINGFICDTEYNGRGLKGQFKQADRLNSKFLILLNDKDLNNNEVTIKDNETKKEELVNIDYINYYLQEALIRYEDINLEDFDFSKHECNCGDNCTCGDECDCDDDNCGCSH